jgi:hypothetical protein
MGTENPAQIFFKFAMAVVPNKNFIIIGFVLDGIDQRAGIFSYCFLLFMIMFDIKVDPGLPTFPFASKTIIRKKANKK